MSLHKVNIDTSILPSDVLSYMDNKFYDLVEELTSENESTLLEIQQINNINAFLLTENLLEFLDLNSSSVQAMKKKLCFELANNTYVVKPGIRANLQYLTALFRKKVEENQKEVKSRLKRLRPTDEITITDNEDDIKVSILRAIKRWCDENKENFELNEFRLEEPEHFILTFVNDEQAVITCKCNEKIGLFKVRGKFQLSNLYRHYRRSKCSMIEKLKKDEKEKENYRVLSVIAATLPPSDTRALLLSSTQNPNERHIQNISSIFSTTETSTNNTSKRRTNTETNNDIEQPTRKKKK